MGWELMAISFAFKALDYGLAVMARDPKRAEEARPLIARVQVMIAERRPPNAEDYEALDVLNAAMDAELDAIIADDET